MKYVRIAVVILLIASLGIYGAGVVREKQGEDPTRPVITSDREVLEIPVSYEEADLLEGLSASDERDGDLTDQILVGEFSQFVEKGVCNVSYVVFDSSNQAATLSRQVRFTDYVSPRITLSEPLVFTEGQTESAIERIGASDVLDGDITSLGRQNESDIDYRTAGDYSITVEVTNSFWDLETETLPVHVVEPSRLGLEIGLTANIVYLDPGENFEPYSYVESLADAYGDALDPGLVQADSGVDTSQEGCYQVHYYAESESGLEGETWLTVIVRA